MSKTPETVLKDEVVEFLNKSGLFYRRMQSGKVKVRGGFMQLVPEGTADFLVCKRTMTYWLELKAPKGTTAKARKEAQAAFGEEVRALGHTYAICESLSDVQEVLNGLTIREV